MNAYRFGAPENIYAVIEIQITSKNHNIQIFIDMPYANMQNFKK